MTVIAVAEDEIDCVWIGDEGEYFRQAIPSVALTVIDEDEDEDEDEDADNDEDDSEHDEEVGKKGKRKVV